MELNLIKLKLVWITTYGRNFHILAKKYETVYVLFKIEESSRENAYILRRPQNFAKSSTYFWLALHSKVINVGSDTFGNPIFHEGL